MWVPVLKRSGTMKNKWLSCPPWCLNIWDPLSSPLAFYSWSRTSLTLPAQPPRSWGQSLDERPGDWVLPLREQSPSAVSKISKCCRCGHSEFSQQKTQLKLAVIRREEMLAELEVQAQPDFRSAQWEDVPGACFSPAFTSASWIGTSASWPQYASGSFKPHVCTSQIQWRALSLPEALTMSLQISIWGSEPSLTHWGQGISWPAGSGEMVNQARRMPQRRGKEMLGADTKVSESVRLVVWAELGKFPGRVHQCWSATQRKWHSLFQLKANKQKRLQIPAGDQISRSVVSNSLWPHESQHARPPCPSPTPGVHSDSCPLS